MKRTIGFTLVGLSVFILYFFGFTEDGQSFGDNLTYAVRSVLNL